MLLDTIRRLRSEGHQVPLVVTCRAAPEYDVREDDFKLIAEEAGGSFLQTQDINRADVVEQLRAAGAEVAVSVNWVSIVGPEVCELFRHGVLNAHAGDLPRYRGNAPVAWAILQGERRVGVTVHRMDPFELDSGAVVLKEFYPITEETYIGEVFAFLDRTIPEMFARALDGLQAGTLTPVPQPRDPGLSLRCYPRLPEDGLVHWERPAAELAALVRASAEPFGGAFSHRGSERVTIWRARQANWPSPSLAVPGQVAWRFRETGEVAVATGDGLLVVEEVETSRTGRVPAAAVLRSARDRLRAAPLGASPRGETST
jgi:methionyl-tRNA formyltransferase